MGGDRIDAMLIQNYLDKIAELEAKLAEAQADLRNALALLRYCFDSDDIPVIYTVEELREWVNRTGQGAIAAARKESK